MTRRGKEVFTFDVLSRTLMMCNFNSGYNLFIHYLVCFSFNLWITNGELDISFISQRNSFVHWWNEQNIFTLNHRIKNQNINGEYQFKDSCLKGHSHYLSQMLFLYFYFLTML